MCIISTWATAYICSALTSSSGSESTAFSSSGQMNCHICIRYSGPRIRAHSSRNGKLSAAAVLTPSDTPRRYPVVSYHQHSMFSRCHCTSCHSVHLLSKWQQQVTANPRPSQLQTWESHLQTLHHCRLTAQINIQTGHLRDVLPSQSQALKKLSQKQLEMWANAQPDGRPAEYRWRPLLNAAVWLTSTTRVPCSNAAKTRNPLKLPGVPQTNETISAASRPKFTILWGHLEEILLLNKFFFSDCRYVP